MPMIIKFKKETREGLEKTLNLLYFGTPLIICIHTGMSFIFGAREFGDVLLSDVFIVSGTIVLLQMGISNRSRIFDWIKDWKKRNVKDGILEI